MLQSPSDCGFFSEYVRRLPGSQRSTHPTHSLIKRGNFPEKNLTNHQKAKSPCGDLSPWTDLVETNGSVLIIGCNENSITLTHRVEEELEHNKRCFSPRGFNIKNGNVNSKENLSIHRPYYLAKNKKSIIEEYLIKNKSYNLIDICGVPGKIINAHSILQAMKNYFKNNSGQKKSMIWWLSTAIKIKIKSI